jgi:D-xylose transport system ATP-binding protein
MSPHQISPAVFKHQGPKNPTLELNNICKHFGGVQALNGVSLSVNSGEVIALVGDNGAGKSTLIKTISGINIPDRGEILRDGKIVKFSSPHDAMSQGIQTVYQDLALCDNLDTVKNLFLGRELRTNFWKGARLRRAEMEVRARVLLSQLGVSTLRDLAKPVGLLSGGQRQSVAVCRSILWDPKIVVLDEPTAALGVEQRREVIALIMRLRSSNHAVIVASHELADVQEVADRIVVLRLGAVAAEFARGSFTRDELVGTITGLRGAAPAVERQAMETGHE